MAGIFKKKSKMFNEAAPMSEMKDTPPSVDIEEADGGYTIRCRGGKMDYGSRPKVATSLEDALAIAKKHLGKSSSKDD